MRSFRTLLRVFITVVLAGGVLYLLDFTLYPCTFTRNDIHAVITGDYDDIYVGTSHGKMAIDPATIEEESGRTGFNLCVGGEYSQDVYYLTKLILESGHTPSRLVYEISPGYFTSEKEEGNNYLLFYHEFPASRTKWEYFCDAVLNCDFRTMLFPWYEYTLGYELKNAAKTVKKKATGDFGAEDLKSDTQEYHENGFVERYPVDTSLLSMTELEEFHTEDVSAQDMDYLKRLITLCKENNIELVAVVTPIPGATLSAYADSFAEAYQYFEDFFKENDVRYLNFNSNQYYSLFSHEIESYTDYDGHLNGDAAREFSKLLSQALNGAGVFAAPSEDSGREIAG